MIAADWRIARLALQIIGEEGPGRAMAAVQDHEDYALAQSLAALNG